LRRGDVSALHTVDVVSALGKQPSALGARPHSCRLRVRPQPANRLKPSGRSGSIIRQEITKPLQRVVFETPALLAVYLRNLYNLQNATVTVLQDRAKAATATSTHDALTLRAVTAAAFGCLLAAQVESLESTTEDSIAATSMTRWQRSPRRSINPRVSCETALSNSRCR
jgi:hypothetical protein